MEYIKMTTNSSLRWIYLLLIVCFFQQSGLTQGPTRSKSNIHFRDGAVINAEKNEIYISTKEYDVQALNLSTGNLKWNAKIQGRPLFVRNNILYIQAKNEKPSSELRIIGLDLNKEGSQVNSTSISLPEGVNCLIKGTSKEAFYINPYQVDNLLVLEWKYRTFGHIDSTQDNKSGPSKGVIIHDGNKVRSAKYSELPKNYNDNPTKLKNNDYFSEFPGQKFISKDKNHVLVSTFKSNPGIIKNYIWKIYDLKSKKLIGQLENNVSYTPFMVKNSTLIYEQSPYQLFDQEQVQSFRLQMIWHDLLKNRTIKSVEILDSTYRGPSSS